MSKKQINIRATTLTRLRLDILAREYGTKTAVIELALRNLYMEEIKINKGFKRKAAAYMKKHTSKEGE